MRASNDAGDRSSTSTSDPPVNGKPAAMSTLLIWVGVVGGVGSVFFPIVTLPSLLLKLVGVPVFLCIVAVMIQAARDVAHDKLTKKMLILLLVAGCRTQS